MYVYVVPLYTVVILFVFEKGSSDYPKGQEASRYQSPVDTAWYLRRSRSLTVFKEPPINGSWGRME